MRVSLRESDAAVVGDRAHDDVNAFDLHQHTDIFIRIAHGCDFQGVLGGGRDLDGARRSALTHVELRHAIVVEVGIAAAASEERRGAGPLSPINSKSIYKNAARCALRWAEMAMPGAFFRGVSPRSISGCPYARAFLLPGSRLDSLTHLTILASDLKFEPGEAHGV